jgi:hypothetical protein
MGRGDTFDYYLYSSDDTTGYAIKLSAAVAAQAGFTATADPRTTKVWGYGPKNLRHVYGKGPAAQRDKIPIATNSNTLYTTGGSFTLGGVVYAVEGAIGEKRKLNSIA